MQLSTVLILNFAIDVLKVFLLNSVVLVAQNQYLLEVSVFPNHVRSPRLNGNKMLHSTRLISALVTGTCLKTANVVLDLQLWISPPPPL